MSIILLRIKHYTHVISRLYGNDVSRLCSYQELQINVFITLLSIFKRSCTTGRSRKKEVNLRRVIQNV